MNPENLPRAVLRDIQNLEIFAPGDSVRVALSGGICHIAPSPICNGQFTRFSDVENRNEP